VTSGILPPFLAQSFTRKLKADEERAVRGSFAVVGLCFCTSHLSARCPPASPVAPALASARGMIGRVLYTAAFFFFLNTQTRRRYVAARINLPLYRAPNRGTSLGPFVCGARACSLCSCNSIEVSYEGFRVDPSLKSNHPCTKILICVYCAFAIKKITYFLVPESTERFPLVLF
jgi:hypothetical protein